MNEKNRIEKPASTPEAEGEQAGAAIPVVGIGASAGGLEALREFFEAMAPDSKTAFVIIQHLSPEHESRTSEILAKNTAMPVVEAQDGMPVQADHVYTNPANRYVGLQDGTLRLSEQVTQDGIRKPIDFFLTSLADERKDGAVGIILSGSSGSDGLRGARAVRAAGGICIAQEPQSAGFPEMPQSLIDAGMADFVLPVEKMPQALLAYIQGVRAPRGEDDGRRGGLSADDVGTIVDLLSVRTHSDFRHYKKATVQRRIRRRMGLKQITDAKAYLKLLREDAQELTQLSTDMLISVSSFFRDTEAFEALEREAIAPLAAGREADAPLRAWIAGCATGEEAYSIAMLLIEAAAEAGKDCPVQVFASDVDEQALETARSGIYPASIAEDISPERLERFFTRQGDGWRVDKRLRETVVFSRHNLLTDPPFSKLDIVSCRNVLIYLEPAAQKKVLTLFSFALNRGGYLFLGKSESVAGLDDDLFEPVSQQKRIFRLLRTNRRAAGEYPIYSGERPAGFAPRGKATPLAQALSEANAEALLRHFKSSLVLIEPNGRILYFHGETEKYLGHPKGLASMNLLDLTGGLLSAKLRRAIEKALHGNEAISIPSMVMPTGETAYARLTVMPIAAPALGGEVLAVIFEDAQPVQRPDGAPVPVEDEPLVAQLEAEVKALRGELRSDAEEYGYSSEELKAANEEITSMNEELQSANEEMEASKEELQSLNEELTTVNSQLNENVQELTATNNDLANLMSATQIATVFLDRQLRIKRFTPRATELLNLLPADTGRPIGHVTQNFVGGALAANAQRVLDNLSTVETDVQAQDGRWFTIRVLPYRTLDDRIEGVVITFSNVTRLMEAERELQHQKDYAEGIVETVRHPLIVLDSELQVLSANTAFYGLFRVKAEDTMRHAIYDLGERQWDIPRLRELLQDVILKQTSFEDFEVEREFPQIGRRTMLLTGRGMVGAEGARLLLAIEDITERKKDRDALRALNENLEQRVTERTALAERRADQLRDLASELTRTEQRERERLARVLHDDLQQLLVGAQFHLVGLRSQSKRSAQQKMIEQVDALIRQSLEASRSLTAELSPTILFEAGLDAALPWLARQMKIRHGIDIRTEINACVPQDEKGVVILLFQAVRELLFNVVKHGKVQEAVVELDRIDSDHVRVVISDAGVGFDPSQLDAGGASEKSMGLFGVRERMEQMGGSVTIESAPNQGTRVTLTACASEPPERMAAPPAASPKARVSRRSRAVAARGEAKIRVLLVDDHAVVRDGIAGILEQTKDMAVVGKAADGAEAVRMASEDHPDVIIMDVSMPGMSGIEATRIIHDAQPDIRIIGLSMYEEADRRAEEMRQGATAYLSKGCRPEELLAAIRAAVGESG